MNVLHRAQDLVDEVLHVIVREILPGVDDSVQVRLHEVGDDVDILKGFERARLQDAGEREGGVGRVILCVNGESRGGRRRRRVQEARGSCRGADDTGRVLSERGEGAARRRACRSGAHPRSSTTPSLS